MKKNSKQLFYKNKNSGALWPWTKELQEYAGHNSHLMLCDENGIEIQKEKSVPSYKELAAGAQRGATDTPKLLLDDD